MDNKTGSCYKLHSKILPWSEAFKTCAAEGGYLAVINSDEEAELVKNILAKQSSKNFKAKYCNEFYIGYHDWGQLHNYMTIHGNTLR